jgi:hypothetical protein
VVLWALAFHYPASLGSSAAVVVPGQGCILAAVCTAASTTPTWKAMAPTPPPLHTHTHTHLLRSPVQVQVPTATGDGLTPKPLADLQVGDLVASVDDHGAPTLEPVLGFLHRAFPGPQVVEYLDIATASGDTLRLTPDHLVYSAAVGEEGTDAWGFDIAATPVQAGTLGLGDWVWVVGQGAQGAPASPHRTQVTAAQRVWANGVCDEVWARGGGGGGGV